MKKFSNSKLQNDIVAAIGEFFGTILFLLLGLGGIQAAANSNSASLSAATQQSGGSNSINTVASIEQLLYISAAMGLSLLVSAWFFFRVTGGVFNPQVALALVLCRIISPVRFILYVIAQIVGGIVASALLQALLPGPLAVTPSLGDSTSKAQGLFIEMFLTSALVFAVLMLAAEKHRTTAFAPIGIGLTLFACHLWGVVFTGAAMNTARAFGPAVVSGFNTEHWIYWLGPTLGSLLASALYIFLKYIKYWKLNPGQDEDDPTESPVVPLAGNRTTNDELPNGEKRASLDGTVGRNSTHIGSPTTTLASPKARETV